MQQEQFSSSRVIFCYFAKTPVFFKKKKTLQLLQFNLLL